MSLQSTALSVAASVVLFTSSAWAQSGGADFRDRRSGIDSIDTPLSQELVVARATGAEAMVAVYLVMSDQLEAASLTKLAHGQSREHRRRAIVARLKAHATASQAAVRVVLDAAVAAGRAGKVQTLWMGNAVVFSAQPDVIESVAVLPGVDRIRLDIQPDRKDVEHALPAQAVPIPPALAAPAAVPPPAPSPGPATAASPASSHPAITPYPFVDEFESGVLKPWWAVATTGKGYAKISSTNGPIGVGHLLMATSVDGVDSTASVTLTLNLLGKTDVGVRFQHKSFADDPGALDGVFVSSDGVSYFQALSLQGGTSAYSVKKFDLDQVVASLGLVYTSAFNIRFQWHDNFDIPTDGFSFDSIMIGPDVDNLPGPPPEPNLVALQAPELWSLGYLGKGVLMGTLDSGVDIGNPDLIHRIWNNPGEVPGNGIDDDLNGFIDDIHGWDFVNLSNDVTSADPHGTETAAIAVGDGSGGKSTGMAPEATLLTCEVLSQVSYWLAEQYCVDNGVDVITSSFAFRYSNKPDYHMFRKLAEVELVSGITHANGAGNDGFDLVTNPIPFNTAAPANSPPPFTFPGEQLGGHSSVLACSSIYLPNDEHAFYGSVGPSAWEDMTLYSPTYAFQQDPSYWDYPHGGFGGNLPGLIRPDLVAYGKVVTASFPVPYVIFDGTSAATPQVAGALALLLNVRPQAEPRHLAAALEFSAVDLGAPGKDTVFGAGKLQAFDAAQRLRLLARVDDQSPSIGSELGLDVYGGPSTMVHGWFSGAIAASSSSPFNLVQPLFSLGLMPLSTSGSAHVSFTIPATPVLIGATVWIQFGCKNWDPAWGLGHVLSVPEWIMIEP